MTNEQREAIEICKEKIIESFYDFPNPTSIELKDTDVEAIEIVLSLIKEQQEEIVKYKALYERALSDVVKADKIIELMADLMYKTGTGRRALSCMFRQNDECNENGCRHCIKQYFENQAKTSQ